MFIVSPSLWPHLNTLLLPTLGVSGFSRTFSTSHTTAQFLIKEGWLLAHLSSLVHVLVVSGPFTEDYFLKSFSYFDFFFISIHFQKRVNDLVSMRLSLLEGVDL